MTQQEATDYIKNIKEEDLLDIKDVGKSYINDAADIRKEVGGVDCTQTSSKTYEGYDCETFKSNFLKMADTEEKVGKAYTKLSSDDAGKPEIEATITALDEYTALLKQDFFTKVMDEKIYDEILKGTAYNKSLLVTALQENK